MCAWSTLGPSSGFGVCAGSSESRRSRHQEKDMHQHGDLPTSVVRDQHLGAAVTRQIRRRALRRAARDLVARVVHERLLARPVHLAQNHRGGRATPGTGRGCTDTRPGAPRGTRTTEAEASRPCAVPAPGASAPSPAPAAEPATAPSADTAPLPAARRPGRPAAARTLPPPGPAGRSYRPCCGRSGEWPRSPGCSGEGCTSAGVRLESWRW